MVLSYEIVIIDYSGALRNNVIEVQPLKTSYTTVSQQGVRI